MVGPGISLRVGQQPITHRGKHVMTQWEEMQRTGELKGKFRCPENLTIITCHNYPEEPILEKNLKFLGISFVTLKEDRVPFKFVYKLERLRDYLKTAVKTPYVLFCDASDVIIRDDPNKIVQIFEKMGHDLLFNSTMFKGGWICMPDKYEWYLTVGKRGHFLNSGVFIGKWDFTLEVIEDACSYITPDSLTIEEYLATGRGDKNDPRLCKRLPNYPYGSPDQDILRYIHPKYYPRMHVDIYRQITYRS